MVSLRSPGDFLRVINGPVGRCGVIESHDERQAPAAGALPFSRVYDRYYRRLVRLAERQLHDPHLAEDVAQETLVQALRYFHAYDRTRPLWPWLRTIAVRIAHRQRQQASSEHVTDLSREHDDLLSTDEPPNLSDPWTALRSALSAVPARQRTALVVRYIGDWSSADAAQLFGMDPNAFEQLLWRGRRRLAAEYRRVVSEESEG